MKTIIPVFNSDNDRLLAVATILLSLFFMFIPGLLAILIFKDKLSSAAYEIAKAFFNLELLLFLISLLFTIPVIGWLLGIFGVPIICVFNIVIIIISLCKISKGESFSIPVPFEFV